MGVSLKITKLRSSPVSPSYLKQGIVFTVYLSALFDKTHRDYFLNDRVHDLFRECKRIGFHKGREEQRIRFSTIKEKD